MGGGAVGSSKPAAPLSKLKQRKLLRKWERKADRAVSEYVRAASIRMYKVCPFCQERPIQCCFHFITRRRKILRWVLRNVIGSCKTCNYIERYWPDLSRAWFIKHKGLKWYLEMVEVSKQGFEPTIEFLQGIVDRFKKLLLIETHFVDTKGDK